MSDDGPPPGYNAGATLLPAGGGAIMAMRGGGALPTDYTQSGYTQSVLPEIPAGAAPIAAMKGGANGGPKKLTLLGKAFTLEDPSTVSAEGDLTEAQKGVLGHLSVPADMDIKEKKAILEAIYNHNCLTDPTLALDGSCEPLRALVGALSMALLNKVMDGEIKQERPAKVDDMVQIVIKVPIGRLNLRAGAGAGAAEEQKPTAEEVEKQTVEPKPENIEKYSKDEKALENNIQMAAFEGNSKKLEYLDSVKSAITRAKYKPIGQATGGTRKLRRA